MLQKETNERPAEQVKRGVCWGRADQISCTSGADLNLIQIQHSDPKLWTTNRWWSVIGAVLAYRIISSRCFFIHCLHGSLDLIIRYAGRSLYTKAWERMQVSW